MEQGLSASEQFIQASALAIRGMGKARMRHLVSAIAVMEPEIKFQGAGGDGFVLGYLLNLVTEFTAEERDLWKETAARTLCELRGGDFTTWRVRVGSSLNCAFRAVRYGKFEEVFQRLGYDEPEP
ncbi:MAG: hypothetical protein ABIE03_04760 [Patescibacteria group bacterium]|nr:hypothetical protein [Patescibacteria group bacterium]